MSTIALPIVVLVITLPVVLITTLFIITPPVVVIVTVVVGRVIPASLVILFAVSVTKVKCI